MRLLLALTLLICALAPGARADLVSPYGGETAPSFAEIRVLEDRVSVELEIDTSDYPFFVAPETAAKSSLAARTGRTFKVLADGVEVEPVTQMVDLRQRTPRQTAATSLYPQRPRSDQVVYVALAFPLDAQPERITFVPPLDRNGVPLASLGVLVEHLGVPVTDYRYLSQAETLLPDWSDPWFSRFENPNLTRHHKSPLMAFLTMDPREVRHEVIFRLRDLEGWADLGLGAAETLSADQMDTVRLAARDVFAAHNPVEIDGAVVRPAAVRIAQIAVGADGLRVLEAPGDTDRGSALLGAILSYPVPTLPKSASLTWDLFPDGIDAIPVTLTDPAGGVPATVRRDDPTANWVNYLKQWQSPMVRPLPAERFRAVPVPVASIALALIAALSLWVAIRREDRGRIAATALCAASLTAAVLVWSSRVQIPVPGVPAPDHETAPALVAGVLDNVSVALLEIDPERFEAALAVFVADGRADAVATEIRRGLTVSLPSGASARTDRVTGLEVEDITSGPDRGASQILARWTADVSGGHWGHMHRRQIEYRGLMDLRTTGEVWVLDGLTVLSSKVRGGI